MKAQQLTTPVKYLILKRSLGCCEICGRPAVHFHHRRPRKAGGSRRASTNQAANILHLCLRCHDRIERGSRTEAEANGWLVPDNVEPVSVSALLMTEFGPLRVWLRDDGSSGITEALEVEQHA